MANVRNSNTFFIDIAAADELPATPENLAIENIKVSHVTVTSTGANARLTLRNVTTDDNKLIVRISNTNTVEHIDYGDHPIVFPNGIHPEDVFKCTATLIIQETGR